MKDGEGGHGERGELEERCHPQGAGSSAGGSGAGKGGGGVWEKEGGGIPGTPGLAGPGLSASLLPRSPPGSAGGGGGGGCAEPGSDGSSHPHCRQFVLATQEAGPPPAQGQPLPRQVTHR